MINTENRFGVSARMAWFNANMPQRCLHVTTIPTMLAEFGGHISKVAEKLGSSRGTISKYKDDQEGERHVIVNGTLFIQGKLCNGHKKGVRNEATS